MLVACSSCRPRPTWFALGEIRDRIGELGPRPLEVSLVRLLEGFLEGRSWPRVP